MLVLSCPELFKHLIWLIIDFEMDCVGCSHGNVGAVGLLCQLEKYSLAVFNKAIGSWILIIVTINWPLCARNWHFSNSDKNTMKYRWHYLNFTNEEMWTREALPCPRLYF